MAGRVLGVNNSFLQCTKFGALMEHWRDIMQQTHENTGLGYIRKVSSKNVHAWLSSTYDQ